MPVRLFFVICLFVCALARAESLQQIDAIVARAPSLDAFLADPALVEEYYKGLQGYYGADRFPRAAFDEVLAQLRTVKEKVPELKTKLWETTGIGKPFSVTTDWVSHGRNIDIPQWDAHLLGMVRKLEATFGDKLAMKGKFQGILDRFDADTAAMEAGLAGKKRADADRARREYFQAKRADPELKAAAAYLLWDKLTYSEVKDKLTSGDADLVLETLNELRGSTRAVFESMGVKVGAAATLMQEQLPTLAQILERKDLFPIAMRKTNRGAMVPVGRAGRSTFTFNPIPRRLHGIFKGIPLKECVGGGYENRLTPERWATAALTDTQFYHVEKQVTLEGGETASDYLGFTQHIPLRDKKTGDVVGSTDFGVPAMRNRKLFNAWLTAITPNLPEGWRGLAVGDKYHINNAGVLQTVHSDKSYQLGIPLGKDGRWAHLDDTARAIVKQSPGDPWGYSGDMIFDGRGYKGPMELFPLPGIRVRYPAALTLLQPNWEKIGETRESIAAALAEGDLERRARVAVHLQEAASADPRLAERLADVPAYPRLLEWKTLATQLGDFAKKGGIDRRTRVAGQIAGLTGLFFGGLWLTVPMKADGPGAMSLMMTAIGGLGGLFAVMDLPWWPGHYHKHLKMLRDEAALAGKLPNPVRSIAQHCRAALRTVAASRTP